MLHEIISKCLLAVALLHIFISSFYTKSLSLPNQLKIGFLSNEHHHEQELVFKWTIDNVNKRNILKRTKLHGITRDVSPGDSFDSGIKACELLAEGAIAIIGPSDDTSAPHVSSLCDSLDVPHFNVITRRLEFDYQSSSTVQAPQGQYSRLSNRTSNDWMGGISKNIGIDMSIRRTVLYEACLDLIIDTLKWKQFIYVYDRDDSLYHFQELLLHKRIKNNHLNMRIVKFDSNKPFRETFWLLSHTKARLIMLDVECQSLQVVLKHAQQVSMMTEAHSYLIVCLDTQTLDLEDFRHSRVQMIWMNSIDLESIQLEAMSTEHFSHEKNSVETNSIQLAPDRLHIGSAQIHDAIMTIAYALNNVATTKYIDQPMSFSCDQPESSSHPDESTILNYIKTSVDFKGMTGQVRFDPMGDRSDYTLNILELRESGPVNIGNWSRKSRPTIKLASQEIADDLRHDDKTFLDNHERRDLLIVVSIKSEPYFMYKQTSKVETGNSRYEGYAVDLIDELSRIVGFDYVFKQVDDGQYGIMDNKTKTWNGMIHEIMSGKADLAIADLSITSSREDAVDFTLPFMNTGISVLFKKPTTKELEFFSFLSPFENHVWFYVFAAYFAVSILLFLVGNVSPYEWNDPHPCRREHHILRNQFSLMNCFWFTMAAVMQQGSDIAPRSLSTRLIASIWYFFTLIMISSYTANLAAFLTVEKVVYPIEKAEDLYRHPQNIKYGCVVSGSTRVFFQQSRENSIFRKMISEMNLVKNNEEGKAEVSKGNYAFFMESTSIEYTIERDCNLTQIGGLLDSKGYGIAIAKNSTRKRDYRTKLSEAILSLQENGILEVLKNRWWKEKRGGGACDIEEHGSSESVKELTLDNVGGVFAIVLIGVFLSFIICAIELYLKSHKAAMSQDTSRWDQVKRRVRFALDLKENY